ncbi:hypothetical protein Tco_1410834 [Tanacetum coccineum]
MLGAAGVQIPKNNLDDLHSSREEDGTSETMDPQDLLGVSLSRAVGFLGGTSVVVVILVKGHALPTIVKFPPVGLQVYPIFVNTFPVGFQTFLFKLFLADLDLTRAFISLIKLRTHKS